MNYIFFALISVSIIAGILNNTLDKVVNAMLCHIGIWINQFVLTSCNTAVHIALSLIGIMAFWLGIMRIAEKSGLVQIISKVLYPVTKFLFKDVKKDSPAVGDIAMSVTANALGLTNAATPIGLKVMKELQEENPNKEKATDAMCMFLGMNTAGFQIIPATVIAVLVGAGASNPTDIILPTLIVTTLSFLTAITAAIILRKIWRED